MAKDYGRKKTALRRSNGPNRFFWFLASFLMGYLTATVFDFTSLSSWVNANLLTKSKDGKPKVQAVAKEPELPKPNFEFYTLLAKDGRTPAVPPANKPQTVVNAKPAMGGQQVGAASIDSLNKAPAATTTPVQLATPTPIVKETKTVVATNLDKNSYLVQLAAFKNKQDADRMKAALTLKGFKVSVDAASQAQGTWYRVIVGPFNSKVLAEKTQSSLAQSEKVKGIVRKVNV